MNQEDRYLRDLLTGKEPEKKIFVSMNEEKKKPKGNVESDLTKIMQEVRMPWFCPKCNKVMKSRLDDKMWKLFDHCFDCQQQLEHKLSVLELPGLLTPGFLSYNYLTFILKTIHKSITYIYYHIN